MPVPPEEVFTTALEKGRDAFLQAVDETYQMTCVPDLHGSPGC